MPSSAGLVEELAPAEAGALWLGTGLQLFWSRRAPAQLKGRQWLQSSGPEGWGRPGPAWKLSSLQGAGSEEGEPLLSPARH